jgi:hypothetical protein
MAKSMRPLPRLALLCAASLTAAPALADGPAPDRADELRQTAMAYFGKSALDLGVIAIDPQGEGYLATVDFQRAVDRLHLPEGQLAVGRWSILMVPMADGAWKISADNLPWIAFNESSDTGSVSGSMRTNDFRLEGVYDPTLGAFRSSAWRAASVDFKFYTLDRTKSESSDTQLHDLGVTLETQAADAGGGAVTTKFREKDEGAHETVTLTHSSVGAAPASALTSDGYRQGPSEMEGSFERLRTAQLLNLWRFLVASGDQANPEAAIGAQSELRAKLLAALPLWDNLKATATVHDVGTDAPDLAIAIKTLSETVAIGGLDARSDFQLALKLDDLRLKSPLIPAWVEPLMPTAVDFDINMSVAGLDKAARVAIEDIDSTAQPPLSSFSQAKIKAILAAGEPKLILAPGRVTSPSLDLTFEGELALAPKLVGRFKVTADTLDKALAVLAKAADADDEMQAAVQGLTFLKGLAKQGGDGRLAWDIAIGDDGAVTVNGRAMPEQ